MKTIILALFPFITFMDSCHSQSIEHEIVLINVGPYDKGRIGKIISRINSLKPKVLALDIAFPEYTGDVDGATLYEALRAANKLVLPSEIEYEGEDSQGREIVSVYLSCASEFFVPNAKTGFVSARLERDQIQIPEQFIVWQKGSYSDDVYHHFSVVTAMAFDSLRASSFVKSHDRFVDVDFENSKRKFKIFSAVELLSDKVAKSDIEGKIVMMGFLGPGDQDKFLSPMKTNSKGPDIYGLEYLANIVVQVLADQKK